MTDDAQNPKPPADDLGSLVNNLADRLGITGIFKSLNTPENREAALQIADKAKDRLLTVAGELRGDVETVLLEARLAALKKKSSGGGSPGPSGGAT